jgi:predicted alpha/beta-fold hydrolase
MGERGENVLATVQGAVAFSVPLHLHHSCLEISKSHNWLYARRFLKSLKLKVARKAVMFPELDTSGLDEIKTLIEFDNRYTSVLHGFKDALDYYTKCSSLHFLESIQRPTLLASAKNDPFLSADCYPGKLANKNITSDYPTFGGHVGFTLLNQNGLYWSEMRALQFIKSIDRG